MYLQDISREPIWFSFPAMFTHDNLSMIIVLMLGGGKIVSGVEKSIW